MADNVGVERQVEHNRVQARPVERAGRVRLLRVQGKRVAVHKALGDVGVVLVRLDLAEVLALHGGKALQVVDAETNLNDGVGVDRHNLAEVVHAVGSHELRVANNLERALRLGREHDGRGEACARARVGTAASRRADARKVEPLVGGLVGLEAGRKDELHHGVVEEQVHLELGAVRVRRLRPLDGVDKLVKETLGEAVALRHVQVHVLGLDAGLEVRVGNLARRVGAVVVSLKDVDVLVRHHNQVGEGLKVHRELHAVEGERHERERVTSHLRVPEGQGDVQALRAARVGNELLAGLEFANHVLEALAGLARELLVHVQVLGVQRVNDVAADNQADRLQEGKANGVDPVGVETAEGVLELRVRLRIRHVRAARGSRRVQHVRVRRDVASLDLGVKAGEVDNNVLTVDQIARAVERDGRRGAAKRNRVLERLLNRLSGEVGVRRVLQAPVRDGGGTREVKVSRAARDNLRDGTTLRGTRSETRPNRHVCFIIVKSSNFCRWTNALVAGRSCQFSLFWPIFRYAQGRVGTMTLWDRAPLLTLRYKTHVSIVQFKQIG